MASYAEYLVYGVRIKVANSKAPHVWNFDGGLKISADFACANLRDVSSIPEGVILSKYRVLAYMFASMYYKIYLAVKSITATPTCSHIAEQGTPLADFCPPRSQTQW